LVFTTKWSHAKRSAHAAYKRMLGLCPKMSSMHLTYAPTMAITKWSSPVSNIGDFWTWNFCWELPSVIVYINGPFKSQSLMPRYPHCWWNAACLKSHTVSWRFNLHG
jgi:hypothetical protein